MKIYITESQLKAVFTKERLAWILQESLNESKTFENLKKKILNAIAMGVSVATIITAISKLDIADVNKRELMDLAEKTEQIDSTAFNQKVADVAKYMKFALTNQGFTMNSTGLKPETLVKASMEHGFDLPFLMAVAHQESCFGATNRAKRTNSVFSVGSYDNGKNAVTYADPNDSVDDYIKLLKNHYLVNGKTLNDLMTPGNFTNDIGNRYASDKNYEAKIKSLRNLILKKFPDLG